MILEIIAKFSCDECGGRITVGLEPSQKLPEGWCILDEAVDRVRGGLSEEGLVSAKDDDTVLCPTCTNKADETGGTPC